MTTDVKKDKKEFDFQIILSSPFRGCNSAIAKASAESNVFALLNISGSKAEQLNSLQ